MTFFPPISSTPLPTQINQKAVLQHRGLEEIEKIVVKNLTTNGPEVSRVAYDITPLNFSAYSLKGWLDLFFMHVSQSAFWYGEAIKLAAIMTLVCIVDVVSAKVISNSLNTLYDNIIKGRLTYTNFPYKKVELGYYYEQRFVRWGLHTLFFKPFILALAATVFKDVTGLKNSFNALHQLTGETQTKIVTRATEFSNVTSEEGIQDPISLEMIEKEWAQAPRFIQFGHYLLTLKSLLSCIFSKNLTADGEIKHFIENRPLTDKEQAEVVAQLSQLFAIREEEITRLFDPFYCDMRRLTLSEFEKDLRYVNAPEAEKPAVLQDLFFENDLSKAIRNWENLDRPTQVFIREQLRSDWFASRRLINFLRILPEDALNADLKINSNLSFRLNDILKDELDVKFSVSIN